MNHNEHRAKRFDEIASAYVDNSPDENLIDLLTDAMHWADHSGRDFHIAFAQACRHYIHELNDDQLDERRLLP
jgi:hypothetical protein